MKKRERERKDSNPSRTHPFILFFLYHFPPFREPTTLSTYLLTYLPLTRKDERKATVGRKSNGHDRYLLTYLLA